MILMALWRLLNWIAGPKKSGISMQEINRLSLAALVERNELTKHQIKELRSIAEHFEDYRQ